MIDRTEAGDHALVDHFSNLQRARLDYGRGVGHIHWMELNHIELFQWLCTELGALAQATIQRNTQDTETKCADMANMAMMLAARVRGLSFEPPPDPEGDNEP